MRKMPPVIFIQGLPCGQIPWDRETFRQHREEIKARIREAIRYVREAEREEGESSVTAAPGPDDLIWLENELTYLMDLFRHERGESGDSARILMRVGQQIDLMYDELAFRAEGRF